MPDKTIFELIKEAEDGSQEELVFAVVALQDQRLGIDMLKKHISDPHLLMILDIVADQRDALQWYIEGVQDRNEIAMFSSQSDDAK